MPPNSIEVELRKEYKADVCWNRCEHRDVHVYLLASDHFIVLCIPCFMEISHEQMMKLAVPVRGG